jgi:uracil-DNA glycosylase family 4
VADSDEIYERYLARAIKAINALSDDIAALSDPADPEEAPTLGSGHPLADIMLLKERPGPAEVQEGVAFFGRTGNAVLKSIRRLDIDPLLIYGTNCVKRATDDPEDPAGPNRDFLAREIQIVEPKAIVCMGERVAAFLNALDFPLADPIDPDRIGEMQPFTPTIEVLVTPDIETSLDDDRSKRRFWGAFKELGRWYGDLPPY